MKLTHILKPILLFCFVFSIQTQAQNNFSLPSQERVETLLERISNCKISLEQFEKALKTIDENPTNYTYADYLKAKGFKEIAEECISASRKELDAIRKKYPEWFNNPETVIPLNNRQEISPEELERQYKKLLEDALAGFSKRFSALSIPKE